MKKINCVDEVVIGLYASDNTFQRLIIDVNLNRVKYISFREGRFYGIFETRRSAFLHDVVFCSGMPKNL